MPSHGGKVIFYFPWTFFRFRECSVTLVASLCSRECVGICDYCECARCTARRTIPFLDISLIVLTPQSSTYLAFLLFLIHYICSLDCRSMLFICLLSSPRSNDNLTLLFVSIIIHDVPSLHIAHFNSLISLFFPIM